MIDIPLPTSPLFKNLVGKTYGRLSVVAYAGRRIVQGNPKTLWECRCECGVTVVVPVNNLSAGTKSCGCLSAERTGPRKPTPRDRELLRIPLTRGMYAFVDQQFFDVIAEHNWYAIKNANTHYAVRSIPRDGGPSRPYRMHRHILEIAGVQFDFLIDHRDGNGLNNRLSNLRPATRAQNAWNSRTPVRNTSGFKGVVFHRASGRWAAQIQVNHKPYRLGVFDTREDAAIAYNAAAIQHFGEFARLNEVPVIGR